MGWSEDKARAERHDPQIKGVLGRLLIGEAPELVDIHEATDLIVFRMEPVAIACRVRHWEYFERYGDEFTIRASRPGGTKTELAKILEGFADLYFYGFENREGAALCAWVVLDLDVFRKTYREWESGGRVMAPDRRENGDGSSGFFGFRLADFPPAMVRERQTPGPKWVGYFREASGRHVRVGVGCYAWAKAEDAARDQLEHTLWARMEAEPTDELNAALETWLQAGRPVVLASKYLDMVTQEPPKPAAANAPLRVNAMARYRGQDVLVLRLTGSMSRVRIPYGGDHDVLTSELHAA